MAPSKMAAEQTMAQRITAVGAVAFVSFVVHAP